MSIGRAIVTPLTDIIIASMIDGKSLMELKAFDVLPIHQMGAFRSYTLISILRILSKIFRIAIRARRVNYRKNMNIFVRENMCLELISSLFHYNDHSGLVS